MKNFLLFPIIAVFLFFTIACEKKPEPFPIIDMHMHTFEWNKYGEPPPPNLITGNKPAARSDTGAIEAYIAEMDRYNIVLAVGSGQLETAKTWKAHSSERFLIGLEFPRYTAPVNQRLERWPPIDELRERFKSGQLQIIGEVSAQYAGVALNDPKLEPYYALAEELGIPMSLHTGFGPQMSPYLGDPDFRMRHGNPLLLEDVLVKHPKLRIYIAHGGYPYLEETIALMLMYTQVYTDISAINWLLTADEFHTYLKRLMQARLGKRIMFGTDQMIWPETVGMSIDAIESAEYLSEEQKQDIYFNNAANFLRLDKSKYLPGATESFDDSGARIIKVVDSEIRMRPAKPGDKETVSFNLQLQGATSATIQVTGWDIDSVEETVMLVNGQEVKLPPGIVADAAPKTVTIDLEKGLLREGENSITFVFAEAVGGTTGFSILDVKLILREG